jgi:hypothetical protein
MGQGRLSRWIWLVQPPDRTAQNSRKAYGTILLYVAGVDFVMYVVMYHSVVGGVNASIVKGL